MAPCLSFKIVSDNLRLTDKAKTETTRACKCGRRLTHQRKHQELGGERGGAGDHFHTSPLSTSQ